MGFWRELLFGPPATPGIVSPWAPPTEFETFAAGKLLGEMPDVMTREKALKVPGVKRAHGLHCSIVASSPFFQMDGDKRDTDQPGWLTSSASGVSPYHRMWGVASDLFMSAWACVGITEDRDDALHIPFGLWGVDQQSGRVVVTDERIPVQYRARLVPISMGYGENGLLIDAKDTLTASRDIERAWMERVKNPAPATELHIEDSKYDGLSRKEKRKIVDDWNENRRRDGGQTALTPSFIKVNALGQTSADLFEKGRNAIRLDIANHTAVPASIIEGARDGSGSDIHYSSEAGAGGATRNELYDFGTKRFVQAIEARLSLDDVCDQGKSIRADLTGLMAVPTPNTNPTSED
ncbi:hypothetical protein ASE14_08105 [Agromyces sp. Root81]|uniref:hypothetical protein n=1 Tax=Agromyces sp. Root81 TaxID=1736601 RepID=UPI0006F8810B|nr:hypothetical protein [Agromyces sp. Root81]KRC60913.1 hypothetical protein ASE14_08105 [Agromyces sp. Root81]